MADEISIEVTLTYSLSGVDVSRTESFNADVAGDSLIHAIQEITNVAAGEAFTIHGDIANEGWMFAKNLDTTNYVTLGGTDTAAHPIKLLAGESAMFRLSTGGPLYSLANTAACLVEYLVFEV